ncbi:hypothetical protein A3L04_00915 [Thermococcus chitonophagus]|uniref:DUF835 domain-containing protein n=1 Tax=Thermococcus chitonophagus TaxID=54262 RepID=A0A160VRI5_9EURY|nr:DUF835 domain-containing protein [Thermococcus chitonophagus]ASJ15735.1 hypothetical protein A3L04_00915 [Thermococcus chitonophagus]CUX76956.1 hypothetical protein CHITON_0177 [Thermococcus chitonophagus]
MEIVHLGYFVRDLIVMATTLTATVIIFILRRRARATLRYRPFALASFLGFISFVVITLAQIIGALINTTVLYAEREYWQAVRSVLLTVAAFLLLLSVMMFYVPFGRGKYMVLKVVTEPTLEAWGGYWCRREECYAAFKELLKMRLPGIAITRNPPEIFREKLGLKLTPVIWISKVQHEDAISPTRLEYLIQRLADFLKSVDVDKVILIDCVDYLILENGEDAVFKFITTLKDLATLNRGILIVSIEKEALSDKAYNFLTSELEPIENLKMKAREEE